MRILHILDHSIPLQSGYTFRSLAILREQRKLGIETWHVTSSKHYGSEAAVEDIDGYRFFRTSKGALAGLPLIGQYDVVAELKKRLHQLCDDIEPDILHAHSPSLNALAASAVAKNRELPLVYEMRASWEDAAVSHGTCREGGLRYRMSQKLERLALGRADHVVTICQGLSDRIQGWGVPAERITVIHNGVDLDAFKPAGQKNPERLAQYQLQDKLVLGFLGSFYRYEGLHILLDALPRMLASNPGLHLLLVGGGLEEEALKQQAEQLGLSQNITFTGRVPHEQINDFYSLIDLFVYPRESILLTEMVTPLKPLEAMANQGLVIASDIGGHREMIEHGRNGFLFPPDDPRALADTAIELLQQPQLWPELREAGRKYVEQQRCWSKSVGQIEPVYQQLLERQRRGEAETAK
jgi:PEP-CTERM/exosortase A-associated glycosyltransferase